MKKTEKEKSIRLVRSHMRVLGIEAESIIELAEAITERYLEHPKDFKENSYLILKEAWDKSFMDFVSRVCEHQQNFEERGNE